MATSYKNIVITPNISNTSDPKIVFSGGNTTVNTDITLNVYPASNGTLSFEGSAGQLFSITNDLSNSLFSVSDVSGIPSIEVFANGLVSLIPISGNVAIGNAISVTSNIMYVGNSTVNAYFDQFGVSALDAGVTSTYGTILYMNEPAQGTTTIQPSSLGMTEAGSTYAGSFWPRGVLIGDGTSQILYAQPNGISITVGSNTTNLAAASLTLSIGGNITNINAIGVYTGTVNAASHTVGTSLIANSTGMFVGANVSANTTAFDVGNTVISTTNAIFGGTIAANGGIGTAGQVLTSGAGANAYWATPLIKGGAIGSIDYNAERARASGIYSVDAAPTNGPPGASYSNYIQMTERGDTSAQIVVDYATGQLHSRGILTSTPTYSAWQTYLSTTANKTISGGFTVSPYNRGTVTTGNTYSVDPTLGNYQYYSSTGTHTLAAPTSDCAVDILLTNGVGASTITFSGFTVGSAVGSTYANTNGQRFIFSIRRINSISTYSLYALQ
jgi:hypothetical protein